MKRLFFGGIHPKYNKEMSKDVTTFRTITPKQVVIPMVQHIGTPCTPLVKVGDRVLRGTKVGDGEGLCVPVHASVAGTVVAVEPRPHPNGQMVMSVVIENDFTDEAIQVTPCQDPLNTMDDDTILHIIREAGLVGMGGAAFPGNVKAMTAMGRIEYLIANACECEPYITSDDSLLRTAPEQVWDASEARNGAVLCWVEPNGELYDLYIGAEGGVWAGESARNMFRGYTNAERIDFGDAFHTEGVRDMYGMFLYCQSVRELDLSSFDTSRVTDMTSMFAVCHALEEVDLFLLDYKITDPSALQSYTGASGNLWNCTLETLQRAGKAVILRLPVIPGVNDTEDHFREAARLKQTHGCIREIQIMAYHAIGADKWEQLGYAYSFSGLPSATAEQKKLWEEQLALQLGPAV